MRVQQAQGQDAAVLNEFAQYLLRIGDGRELIIKDDLVRIPPGMTLSGYSTDSLINAVYGQMDDSERTSTFLTSHAIVTPKNVNVHALIDR
ncbi:hypothetical protein DFQ28_001365, partial [Apophysomyces sp. BC1034]